jgi:hypothetical protein
MQAVNSSKRNFILLILAIFVGVFSLSGYFAQSVKADVYTQPASQLGDLNSNRPGFTGVPAVKTESDGQQYVEFDFVQPNLTSKTIELYYQTDNSNGYSYVSDFSTNTIQTNQNWQVVHYKIRSSYFGFKIDTADSSLQMRVVFSGATGIFNWNNIGTYYSPYFNPTTPATGISITTPNQSLFPLIPQNLNVSADLQSVDNIWSKFTDSNTGKATANVTPTNTTDKVNWSLSSNTSQLTLPSDTSSWFNQQNNNVSNGKAQTQFYLPVGLNLATNTDSNSYGFPVTLTAKAGKATNKQTLDLGGLKAINTDSDTVTQKGLGSVVASAIDTNSVTNLIQTLNATLKKSTSGTLQYNWVYWDPSNSSDTKSGYTSKQNLTNASDLTNSFPNRFNNQSNFIQYVEDQTAAGKSVAIQFRIYDSANSKNAITTSNRAALTIKPITAQLTQVPTAFNFGSIPVAAAANGSNGQAVSAVTTNDNQIKIQNANRNWSLTASYTPFTNQSGNTLQTILAVGLAGKTTNLSQSATSVASGNSQTFANYDQNVTASLQFSKNNTAANIKTDSPYTAKVTWNLTNDTPKLSSASN